MRRHAQTNYDTIACLQRTQVYARYINVEIQRKFTPIFGTQYLPGANSDGTFTVKADAGSHAMKLSLLRRDERGAAVDRDGDRRCRC